VGGGLMLLCELRQGDSPLIVDVPHAGTHIPDAIALRLTDAARGVPDTDWHVDRLYAFSGVAGATVLAATHSRYVVDLNRDPTGAALYPGADNTELCPTRTFDDHPIYDGTPPSEREILARRRTYFDPYHARLAAEIERIRDRHGYAVVLDGHSIRAEVPRFFGGHLPDLNLGTADGESCAPDIEALAAAVLGQSRGFSHVVNGRFKGGYVTRHFGQPARGVHALQLEIAQDCYMDEAAPSVYDPVRAQALSAVLERLVIALSEWRPRTRAAI
jgi:N-formylglutamate amidohydrolase